MQRVGPQRAAKVQAARVLRESSMDPQDEIDEDGSYMSLYTSSQGRPKHGRGSTGSHLRTDVSPSGRERSEEEEQAIINAIKDENTRLTAMKRFKNRIAARKSRKHKLDILVQLQQDNDNLKVENESLEAQIVRVERRLRAKEQDLARLQKQLFGRIDDLFGKLKEARTHAAAEGQPLDSFELFERYVELGADELPLLRSPPGFDDSPSPHHTDLHNDDLDNSPSAQAELLFADPRTHARYDTTAGLEDFTSSGSEHPSWLDADTDAGNADADTSGRTMSPGNRAAMCL